MLSKGRPVNAADLFAIVTDELDGLISGVRRDGLDPIEQFWNVDPHGKPNGTSRPEETCRNSVALLLRERLGKYGVSCEAEARHAGKKRSDIWCPYENHGIPIEVKKQSHRELWTALQNQLVSLYSSDTCAGGYGIYLVLWFGSDGLKPPPTGKKPKTAQALQARLEEQVGAAQKSFIAVRVIDVSLRMSG